MKNTFTITTSCVYFDVLSSALKSVQLCCYSEVSILSCNENVSLLYMFAYDDPMFISIRSIVTIFTTTLIHSVIFLTLCRHLLNIEHKFFLRFPLFQQPLTSKPGTTLIVVYLLYSVCMKYILLLLFILTSSGKLVFAAYFNREIFFSCMIHSVKFIKSHFAQCQ